MNIKILLIVIYLFAFCGAFKIYKGTFKSCKKGEPKTLNTVYTIIDSEQKRINKETIEDCLKLKIIDYFKVIWTNSIPDAYYINNGQLYKAVCENVDEITLKEDEIMDNELICDKHLLIYYSDNSIGYLDTNGIIRSYTSKIPCKQIKNKKHFDSKDVFLFTRAINEGKFNFKFKF